MIQRSPPAYHTRAAPCACFILVVFFCALAGGCLDTISISDFNRFSLPRLTDSGGELKAYFLDVGQGDSTLIMFGNKTILIDAGEVSQGNIVVQKLKSLGISRIDLLVATHPHADHIGGMERVLDAFAVGQVLDAGMPHPSPLYEHFLNMIESCHIPYTVAKQGQIIEIDPALRILVLFPPDNPSIEDLNDNSVVLRISYGTIDLLLTGDAGISAEMQMLMTGYALDSEILKVAHHGSSHSTSFAFLERVHPQVAVISVGADNPYGHPSDTTLAALNTAGYTIYRTDHDGDIQVKSDGMSYTVQTARRDGGVLIPITALQSPTLSPVTTRTANVPVYEVVISATQFNAPGDDRENLNGEYVRISNRGTDAVSMNGWTLSDRTGSHGYIFPAFILLPESSVSVYTGSGAINDTALFMGRTSPVWGNSGDEAMLKDDFGNIIDTRSEGGDS